MLLPRSLNSGSICTNDKEGDGFYKPAEFDMTKQEQEIEFKHIYETRIAILTEGQHEPTPKEIEIALCDANTAIKQIELDETFRP